MRIASLVTGWIVLAIAVPGRAEVFRPGQAAAARWHSSWYLATIDGRVGSSYEITYGDDTEGTVGADDLRPLVADAAVGDRVLAARGGPRMFPGTIRTRARRGFTIKWDDASAPSIVKLGRIARLERAPAFAVGDRVAAAWGASSWYVATIEAVTSSGYDVLYGDGTRGTVKQADLRMMAGPGELAIGDEVIAVWSGARMYPGVIGRETSSGFVVTWTDRSTPSTVPVGKIAKR